MKKERNGGNEDTRALTAINRLPKRTVALKLGKRQRKRDSKTQAVRKLRKRQNPFSEDGEKKPGKDIGQAISLRMDLYNLGLLIA